MVRFKTAKHGLIVAMALTLALSLASSALARSAPAAPNACPCSLWSDLAVPTDVLINDGHPLEIGLKFSSDVNGWITGIRYYNSVLNDGAHTMHVWAADGTLLSQTVFNAETAAGWQVAPLEQPVYVVANTIYIASYYSPSGNFPFDRDYFSTTGVDAAPLHAAASGGDYDPNGVYRYDSSGFPTMGTAHNYWVDVVFDTAAPSDSTAPTVSAITPAANATGVSILSNVGARFSEALDPATLTTATFTLHDEFGAPINAAVSYNSVIYRAELNPIGPLAYATRYDVTIKGGSAGVKDRAGNPLAADYTWSFTTASAPVIPPDEGPGGPILVVAAAHNPFGRYVAEILRTEGLNEYLVTDISLVDATRLAQYDVVILGETELSAAQVNMLSAWVTAGGNLIALKPDAQLADLMGLTPVGTTLSNAYLLIDTAANLPGNGLVNTTIQFHGLADQYTLNGAHTLATLYSGATTPTAYPALSVRSVGTAGGQAAAFTYDLARSIVYTRQGNPDWAGQERNNDTLVRSTDLFFGGAAFDPQPDWIDFSKIAIPQADEQQRLLANLITFMNLDKKPLPRFWYFPHNYEAVIVMTGDDHQAGGGTIGRFDQYIANSPAPCDLNDWECTRSTSYWYPSASIADATAAVYAAQGFEMALHVNTDCTNYTQASLDDAYTAQLTAFDLKWPSLPAPSTVRTHCVPWSDWASQAKVALSHGIRLDTNYYYWPETWIQNRAGLFTGSGMPMRFADIDGTTLDVYQAPTQMTDESGQTYPATIDAVLDAALNNDYYGAFTVNMHTDVAESAGSNAVLASAAARNVPIIAAHQLLHWLDGRNASTFSAFAWADGVLNFTISLGADTTGIQALLPRHSGAGTLTTLTRGGTPVSVATVTIKGVEYVVFAAVAGTYEATYAGLNAAAYMDADGVCSGSPCYTTLQAAIDNAADGGTITVEGTSAVDTALNFGARRVTLQSTTGGTLNWTGGAGPMFNVSSGDVVVKGLNIQSGAGGTLFGYAGVSQLRAYANNLGGFGAICTGTGCGFAQLGHNWWGTSTYASQPAGLNTASWNVRLGAAVTDWTEGLNAVALSDDFGTLEVNGGSGPIVAVSHGPDSPFFTATEPDICSHYFDVFGLSGASGTWNIAIPIDVATCPAAPTRVSYMPLARLIGSQCDVAGSGCWQGWTPVTRVGDRFIAQGVSTAVLGGTPFVAGSATGNDPTAVSVVVLSARSAVGSGWPIGVGAGLLFLALGNVVYQARKRRVSNR